jgi:hypothetical protein
MKSRGEFADRSDSHNSAEGHCTAALHEHQGGGCLWDWVGDGDCDNPCNVSACGYDDGDCEDTDSGYKNLLWDCLIYDNNDEIGEP